jgi:hypothetical protein
MMPEKIYIETRNQKFIACINNGEWENNDVGYHDVANDSHQLLTPRTPSIKRAMKIGQKEVCARSGESPVSTPLKKSEIPTTCLPPKFSAITPPNNDVTKYPQKNPPRM